MAIETASAQKLRPGLQAPGTMRFDGDQVAQAMGPVGSGRYTDRVTQRHIAHRDLAAYVSVDKFHLGLARAGFEASVHPQIGTALGLFVGAGLRTGVIIGPVRRGSGW